MMFVTNKPKSVSLRFALLLHFLVLSALAVVSPHADEPLVQAHNDENDEQQQQQHGDNTLLERNQNVVDDPFRCTWSAAHPKNCIKLEHCVWCRGDGLPGICVSEAQEEALIKKIPHVKCFGNQTTSSAAYTDDISQQAPISPHLRHRNSPYDPKCLNAPNQSSNDDRQQACDDTTDSNGDSCVWCDGAGVFGLCLNHQQAEKAASYLDCDLNVPLSWA